MCFRKKDMQYEQVTHVHGRATDVLFDGGDGFVDRHDVSDYSTLDVRRSRRNDFTFS